MAQLSLDANLEYQEQVLIDDGCSQVNILTLSCSVWSKLIITAFKYTSIIVLAKIFLILKYLYPVIIVCFSC